MALAERTLSSNTATTDGATTLSVTPTGQQENDWVLLGVVSAGGTGAHTNTAGGLSRATAADIAGGTVTVASTWKKKCGAGESGTTYTFDFGGSTRRACIIAICYSGGDGTDIVESAPAGVASAANATSLAVTGVDPADTGGVHIVWEFSRMAGGESQSFTAPTDYTELFEILTTHATNANAAAAVSTRALPDAAATGDVTFSVSNNDRLSGASVLLKPGGTDATATPSTTAAPYTLPAVTTSAGSTPTPSTLTAPYALPSATASAGSTPTPATLAAPYALPAVTVDTGGGGATATPATLAATTALPPATASAGSTPTPDPLAAPYSLPAVTVRADATVSLTTIATTTALPAATASAGSTPTPTTIAAPYALPQATPDTAGNATVTPDAIAATTSLPAVTVQAGSTATPDVLATVVAFPAATASASSTATPDTLATTTALPQATPQTSADATVTPPTLAMPYALPAVTLSADAGVVLTTIAAPYTLPLVTIVGTITKATSVATVTEGRTSMPAVSATATSVPAVSAGRTSTATVG